MFLDVDFNEGFSYVNNSFLYYTEDEPLAVYAPGDPVLVTDVTEPNPNYFSLAGATDASEGFTLQSGVSFITFKIKVPAVLEDEYDENDQLTGNKEPLVISYNFSSDMDDSCMIMAMDGLVGDKYIPNSRKKTDIITNKQTTTKIKK